MDSGPSRRDTESLSGGLMSKVIGKNPDLADALTHLLDRDKGVEFGVDLGSHISQQ